MEGSGIYNANPSTPSPLLRLGLGFVPGTNGNNGNLQSQTIRVGGTVAAPAFTATQTYAYDGLNRLLSAQEGASWKQTFGYDQWGNRWIDEPNTSNIPVQGGTPVASSAFLTNNQLSGRTYDKSGNGSPMLGRIYKYDMENRIVSVTGGTSETTESFEYDGEGRRVKRTLNGVSTVFVYDAFGQLAQEYGVAAGAGGRNYVFADHLGSTRMLVSGTGMVNGWWDYAPYGEEVTGTVGGRSGIIGFSYAGATPSMMFTGQMRDRLADGTVSGLDYFGARYMSAAQGRFTSPDPLLNSGRPWQPQSWNRYTYTLNNPLKFTDPLGFYEWGECSGTKQECKNAQDAFQAALERLKKTAAGMKVGSRERKRLEAVLNSYGNLGDKGVIVGFNTAGSTAFADTGVTGNLVSKLTVSPDGKLSKSSVAEIGIRFNIGLQSEMATVRGVGFDTSFAAVVAHEGAHIADEQFLGRNPATFAESLFLEQNGYTIQSQVERQLGVKSIGRVVWNPTWLQAGDSEQLRRAAVKAAATESSRESHP